jgi:exosome complex RNA-binding protein Rrp42 (RNase PH superfamily)
MDFAKIGETKDSTEGPSAGAALAPQGTPLALSCTPTALTCGVYGQHLIPDPDHEEEALMDATIRHWYQSSYCSTFNVCLC